MNEARPYVGTELELFAHAIRWRAYYAAHVAPYVRGTVLEVGAGLGAVTHRLRRPDHRRWVCLEPDPQMARGLRRRFAGRGEAIEVMGGTVRDLPREESFDTVLYVDVLEHIEDDRAELDRAFALLGPGGHLVVVAPAHDWLFSPFDAAIGHHRRYDRASLTAIAPVGARLVRLRYLDSVGLFASAANRFLLRQGMPGRRQLLFWDRVLVPLSRLVDPLTRFRWGKSILAVWRKPTGATRQ